MYITGRSIRISSESHIHSLGESQITFIGQGGMDQLLSVPLIFVGIIESGFAHNYVDQFLLSVLVFHLLKPVPVRNLIHVLHDQQIDNLDIMDRV